MYTNSGGKQMMAPHYGTPAAAAPAFMMDRGRWRPGVELAPNCPRCDSSNTKFCYYNNYSLTQPRYFCKGCRRYWTKGGSLRNVPVGGGCRKNRRSSSNKSFRSTRAPEEPPPPPAGGVSVRPDLALDEMIWSSGSSEEVSTSDGSSIDLAQLYEKFLNNWPDQETGVPANHCSSMADLNPVDMGEHQFSLEHDSQIPLQFQEYQNLTSAATMDSWSDLQHDQQPLMEIWGSSLDHELTSMDANPNGVVLDYQHPLTFTGEDHDQELVTDHEIFPSSSCSLPSNNIDRCQGFGSSIGQYDHQQVFGEWSKSDDQPSFEAFYSL